VGEKFLEGSPRPWRMSVPGSSTTSSWAVPARTTSALHVRGWR